MENGMKNVGSNEMGDGSSQGGRLTLDEVCKGWDMGWG